MYHSECHKLIKSTAATISKYNICETACKVYSKALSAENARSGFKRTGIYPLNKDAVPEEYLIPAEVYRTEEAPEDLDCSQDTVPGGIEVEPNPQPDPEPNPQPDPEPKPEPEPMDMFQEKELNLKRIKTEKERKPRKTMSKIVSGSKITEYVVEKMKDHEISQGKTGKTKPKKAEKCQPCKQSAKSTQSRKQTAKSTPSQPKPGPSHINLMYDTDSDYFTEREDEKELCCVCKRHMPEKLHESVSLIFYSNEISVMA